MKSSTSECRVSVLNWLSSKRSTIAIFRLMSASVILLGCVVGQPAFSANQSAAGLNYGRPVLAPIVKTQDQLKADDRAIRRRIDVDFEANIVRQIRALKRQSAGPRAETSNELSSGDFMRDLIALYVSDPKMASQISALTALNFPVGLRRVVPQKWSGNGEQSFQDYLFSEERAILVLPNGEVNFDAAKNLLKILESGFEVDGSDNNYPRAMRILSLVTDNNIRLDFIAEVLISESGPRFLKYASQFGVPEELYFDLLGSLEKPSVLAFLIQSYPAPTLSQSGVVWNKRVYSEFMRILDVEIAFAMAEAADGPLVTFGVLDSLDESFTALTSLTNTVELLTVKIRHFDKEDVGVLYETILSALDIDQNRGVPIALAIAGLLMSHESVEQNVKEAIVKDLLANGRGALVYGTHNQLIDGSNHFTDGLMRMFLKKPESVIDHLMQIARGPVYLPSVHSAERSRSISAMRPEFIKLMDIFKTDFNSERALRSASQRKNSANPVRSIVQYLTRAILLNSRCDEICRSMVLNQLMRVEPRVLQDAVIIGSLMAQAQADGVSSEHQQKLLKVVERSELGLVGINASTRKLEIIRSRLNGSLILNISEELMSRSDVAIGLLGSKLRELVLDTFPVDDQPEIRDQFVKGDHRINFLTKVLSEVGSLYPGGYVPDDPINFSLNVVDKCTEILDQIKRSNPQ